MSFLENSPGLENTPGHLIERPEHWRAGVVFASPHSGAIYPKTLLKASKLSAHKLRKNEDIFIDHLFHEACKLGAPFLRAMFPRVFVDANRAADELPAIWMDGPPPSPRAAAGLGVVPTHLSEQMPIYKNLPSRAEVQARLTQFYHPYHTDLSELIQESLSRFGQCLLIDCHSMPGFAPMGSRRADIILGDRFGTACQPDTLDRVKALFTQAGYSVGINHPYAGGFVTDHYGRPDTGVEALQIEINRDLYVNPVTLSPKSTYMSLRQNLTQIMDDIITSRQTETVLAAQ